MERSFYEGLGDTYVYTILGTLILSAAVNRHFLKRVKNIDMVNSLKGVE